MSEPVKFLLFLILLTPPLISTIFNFGYEESKVLVFLLLMSLAGSFWLWSRPRIEATSIQKASVVFLLILVVTSLIGINPKISFLGESPYFQGLLLYCELILFSIMVNKASIKPQTWFRLLMISAFLVSIIAIKDAINLYILNMPISTYAGRVISTFGQPNFYAGWILLSLPLFYYSIMREKRSLIYKVGFLVCLVALSLSYSKTAIFITGGLILFWLAKSLGSVWKILVPMSVLIIICAAIFAIKYQEGLLWEQLGKANQNYSITNYSPEKRAYIWPTIIDLIIKRPEGYGLENLREVFGTNIRIEEAKVAYAADLKNLIIDRAHNYLLDLTIFSGIPGLLSWLVLVYLMLKKARGVVLTSLIVYLIWIQFQNQSVVHLIYFWWLVGVADST